MWGKEKVSKRFLVVPGKGLEPLHPYGHMPLKHACLPISAPGRVRTGREDRKLGNASTCQTHPCPTAQQPAGEGGGKCGFSSFQGIIGGFRAFLKNGLIYKRLWIIYQKNSNMFRKTDSVRVFFQEDDLPLNQQK